MLLRFAVGYKIKALKRQSVNSGLKTKAINVKTLTYVKKTKAIESESVDVSSKS